jgi:uncharacterized protein DUF5615
MRILFDECVPRPLRRYFTGHFVATVARMGWAGIKNGELLDLADGQFDVLLTVDRSIPFQQNIANRQMAVLVLIAQGTQLEALQPLVPDALIALNTIQPGTVVYVGE